MANIIENAKEMLKKQKQKLAEERQKNYAKIYYKDFSTSGKGREMIVVITEDNIYRYVSQNSNVNAYDLAACIISGAKKIDIDANNSIENLSNNFDSVVIHATPTINKEGTTVYLPSELTEFQKIELENFKRQVEEHNSKYADKVELKEISAQMENENTSTLK